MVADPVADQADAGHKRDPVPPAARRLLRLVTALPGQRSDALAVVNGFFGDALADQGSTLAIPMTLRSATGAFSVDRAGVAQAFPQATGRIAVLVHGLMSTESVWRFPGHPDTSYASLLARDHNVTPIFVRYNTGRHISTNGRQLAGMLHQVLAAWPVPVREISLIGHSMGGLVLRSACHYASTTRLWRDALRLRRSWTAKTRRVVLIGVPNTGAPLEVVANMTSAVLWSLPIPPTRLVGLGIDARSAGIRDLRFGAITDHDWVEQDPDARHRPPAQRVTNPRHAEYLIIAGSVTADADHLLARLFGDTFVTAPSASGTLTMTGQGLFPASTVRIVPKVTHIALAHRPEVYDEIDRWWKR